MSHVKHFWNDSKLREHDSFVGSRHDFAPRGNARSKTLAKPGADGVELNRKASLRPGFAVNPCEAPCSNRSGLRVELFGWQAAWPIHLAKFAFALLTQRCSLE
jgi:hypothetical protein